MATVKSLGLHEPSALSYLVAESILPQDPPTSLYTWHTYSTYDEKTKSHVEEELLWTKHCVVWSRGGIVQRTYNLEAEGETILQAFTTYFAANNKVQKPENEQIASQLSNSHKAARQGDSFRSEDTVIAPSTNESTESHGYPSQEPLPGRKVERGLVVILRSQAHIFMFSGDSNVIPLSFEVENAFPMPRGFILQRKVIDRENRQLDSIPEISGLLEPVLQSVMTPKNVGASRPSLVLPSDEKLQWKQKVKVAGSMPRTFSFTEILTELGLVVSEKSKGNPASGVDENQALGVEEKIIYISPRDELQSKSQSTKTGLCLAVTVNSTAGTISFWQVLHRNEPGSHSPKRREKRATNGHISRRKSSNVYGRTTGAATPLSRGAGYLRESLGGLGQSYSDALLFGEANEQGPADVDDLASQLGPEFGNVGVQTRSARRVSSMLARSDLAIGNDRNTFNDLATVQPGRKSFTKSVRRGESIGSFSDRQSFGVRRRSSFPGNASFTSAATSLLGVPSYRFREEMDDPKETETDEDGFLNDFVREMPREIGFVKIKSFSHAAARALPPEQDKLKVFVLRSPDYIDNRTVNTKTLNICIMSTALRELTIVNLDVQQSHRTVTTHLRIKATEIRQIKNVVDACSLHEGLTFRILILTRTRDDRTILQLEAPWSPSFRVDLPSQYAVFDPYGTAVQQSPDRRREIGLKRMLRSERPELHGLSSISVNGQIVAIDLEHHRHRLQIQLEPRESIVRQILDVYNLVLPNGKNDGLLVAWWEVSKWLKLKEQVSNLEWTAAIVALFAMAVPFINEKSGVTPLTPRKKKTSILRSSSTTAADEGDWNAMMELERPTMVESWGVNWTWMMEGQRPGNASQAPPSPSRSRKSISAPERGSEKRNTMVLHCIGLAREFVQSPAGEAAIGPEGYLPTAMGKDRELRRTAIAAVLVGLHLLREEQKLNTLSKGASSSGEHDLSPILAQLGQWLGWKAWTWQEGNYYGYEIEDVDLWLFEDSIITRLEMPGQPFAPPSIFDQIEDCIREANPSSFPTLLDVAGHSRVNSKEDHVVKSAMKLTPRIFNMLAFLSQTGHAAKDQTIVETMLKTGITGHQLETIPDGVAAVFHKALASQRRQPPSSAKRELLELLDRSDMIHESGQSRSSLASRSHLNPSHEATRDQHTIGNMSLETDNLHSWDASTEADRQSITRLIFREDRRFQEASKLVNQTRPPVVECNPEPDWTEADLLDAQKELVQFVTRRTLSVSAGRGMMHFNARVPLLTERVPIPAFSLQCVMKARSPGGAEGGPAAMTFSADKAAFTEDKVCWAFFHNGASAGLMISREARGIDTSWILYNKPPELTNRHAGFLLALGLNGHLKTLAKWVAFKYLTPKHTMTSIGLLLGLSASYLGTMDTLITRLLSVHVTRLLPVGAAELNLSTLTQTSGIMGVGLVYCGSGHRRMSEVMLSEIENCETESSESAIGGGAGNVGDEPILRDEGYRLAAGFALGLINLGRGSRLDGLRDMGVLERLLRVAVGTRNVDFVNVLDRAAAGAVMAVALVWMKTNDDTIAKKIDVPDTIHQFDYVRPDIFLLRTLARHLIHWDRIGTNLEFVQASLPKAYRARATLRDTRWLSTEDMPFFNIVAGICFAIGLRFAGSMDCNVRDLLVGYLDQFTRLTRLSALNYDAKLTRNSVRHCQDVVALSAAAVMAGSGDLVVLRRLRSLHGRTDADTPYGSHLATHMAIGALFLGGGTCTFGSGDLAVASLLISFYPVFPSSVLDNKAHLQALRHLWVLAVEQRCVVGREIGSGRPVSVPMILRMKDGRERTLQTPALLPEHDLIQSLHVHGPEWWDVHLDFLSSSPPSSSTTNGPTTISLRRRAAYDRPVAEVFVAELQALNDVADVPNINSTSTAGLSTSHHVGKPTFGGGVGGGSSSNAKNALEWVFSLDSLTHLDHAERALVVPSLASSAGAGSGGERLLKGSVVDSRLELEKGVLPPSTSSSSSDGRQQAQQPSPQKQQVQSSHSGYNNQRAGSRDALWQLRLLFAWVDRWDEMEAVDQEEEHGRNASASASAFGGADADNDGDGEQRGPKMAAAAGTWLRREVIDRLRWRVWKMAGGEGDEEDKEEEGEEREQGRHRHQDGPGVGIVSISGVSDDHDHEHVDDDDDDDDDYDDMIE